MARLVIQGVELKDFVGTQFLANGNLRIFLFNTPELPGQARIPRKSRRDVEFVELTPAEWQRGGASVSGIVMSTVIKKRRVENV